MDLILWRHAEAEEAWDGMTDYKRRLTPKGEKQAKKIARWLQQQLPRKCRIIVSPSERTQQTAHALDLPYEVEPKVGTSSTAEEILHIADWPNSPSPVLVIGHQPTLGRIAARLISGDESDWPVKKGSIWWFSSRVRNGATQTILRAALNPDFF